MSAAGLDLEIARLATLLNSLQRGGLAVALCDDSRLRAELMIQFRARTPRRLHEITLNGAVTDIMVVMRDSRVRGGDIVCLFEVERLPDEALTRLEWGREAIWELEVGLLLWVTGEGQRRLLEKAPNFYSRRAVLAQFTSTGTTIVTLVGVDVVQSSRSNAVHTAEVLESVQQSARSFRGEVVSVTGDGLIVEFAQTQTAAEFALALQESKKIVGSRMGRNSPLQLRIALHSGPVVRLGRTIAGVAVERLVRLLNLTQSGQILLSADAREALSGQTSKEEEWRFFRHGIVRFKNGDKINVYELTRPDQTPRSLRTAAINSNLPPRREPFVNRNTELRVIADSLERKTPIILRGPGGIGKTALALEAAHSASAAGRFTGGAFFFRFAEFSSPESFSNELANLLNVTLPIGRSPENNAIRVSHYLGKEPVLLVLDGISESPWLSRSWLENLAYNAALIITSRTNVDLPLAEVLEIGPLSPSAATELFRRRLPVESERDLPADGTALDELIEFSGGNPLVIELLAAQRDRLSTTELLAQLRHQEFVPPQKRLRRDLQYSFDRLSEEDRRLLAMIALFPGSFTEQALARVAQIEETSKPVERLERIGVISIATKEGPTRLLLHELVRTMAAKALSDREFTAARERFVTYYWELAETWRTEFHEEEEPNFLAALEYATLLQRWPAEAELATSLADFWLHRREPKKAAEFASRAEAAARRAENPRAILKSLYVSALVSLSLRDLDRAEAALAECLQIAHQLEEPIYEAQVHLVFAQAELAFERTEVAREHLERARRIYQMLGHPAGEVAAVSRLVEIAYRQGHINEALDMGRQALHGVRSLGDRPSEARLLTTLASFLSTAERVSEAERYYQEAERIFSELNMREDFGQVLLLHARAKNKFGDKNSAVQLARRALRAYETTDSPDASDVRRFLKELSTQ